MKNQVAAAVLITAAAAYARKVPVSYTTITQDDCPTEAPETMITVTEGITVTYCPLCEDTPPPMTHPGYTTTYTTTFMSVCETGTVPATYTITESCTEPEPTWTPGPKHIPQGYTVTEKQCNACGKTPTKVTITEPCDCEAHEGTPGPPAPKPAKPTPPSGYEAPPPGKPAAPPGGNPSPPPEEECSQIEDGQTQCSTPPAGAPPIGGKPAPPSGGDSMPPSGGESAPPEEGSPMPPAEQPAEECEQLAVCD